MYICPSLKPPHAVSKIQRKRRGDPPPQNSQSLIAIIMVVTSICYPLFNNNNISTTSLLGALEPTIHIQCTHVHLSFVEATTCSFENTEEEEGGSPSSEFPKFNSYHHGSY